MMVDRLRRYLRTFAKHPALSFARRMVVCWCVLMVGGIVSYVVVSAQRDENMIASASIGTVSFTLWFVSIFSLALWTYVIYSSWNASTEYADLLKGIKEQKHASDHS